MEALEEVGPMGPSGPADEEDDQVVEPCAQHGGHYEWAISHGGEARGIRDHSSNHRGQPGEEDGLGSPAIEPRMGGSQASAVQEDVSPYLLDASRTVSARNPPGGACACA